MPFPPPMLQGLIRRFFPDTEPEALLAPEQLHAVNLSLDVQAAMAAHERWKIHFEGYLKGYHDEAPLPEQIVFDDRCDLGLWLHGDGRRHLGHLAVFRRLCEDHRTFHHVSANLLSMHLAGRFEPARRLRDGDYRTLSRRVMAALEDLRQQAELGLPPRS